MAGWGGKEGGQEEQGEMCDLGGQRGAGGASSGKENGRNEEDPKLKDLRRMRGGEARRRGGSPGDVNMTPRSGKVEREASSMGDWGWEGKRGGGADAHSQATNGR